MNDTEKSFRVSVITPVYNAAKYVRKAVESAVVLQEVGEVLLVEDNSSDESLPQCRQLEREYAKVRLLQHPDKGNHGPGASRNLGIRKASSDYIAFLDADDYYLLDRFKKDKEILLEHDDIDGVYNAIGIHYYSEKARESFYRAGFEYQEFLSFNEVIPPKELIFVHLGMHPTAKGEYHIDAITLRKRVFDKIGLFSSSLKLGQDVHLFVRLSVKCNLVSGNIQEPVAIRGVHEDQRMTDMDAQAKYLKKCWDELHEWFTKEDIDDDVFDAFEKAYYVFKIKTLPKWPARKAFLLYLMKHPVVVKEEYGFFDLKLFESFGRIWWTLHFVSAKNRLFRKMRNREKSHLV